MIMQHATYSITFLCSRLISSLFYSLPFLILLNIIVCLFEYFFIERKLRGNYNFKKNYRQTLLVTIAILGTTVVLNSSKDIFSNGNDPALTIITSIYSLICCVCNDDFNGKFPEKPTRKRAGYRGTALE